MIEEIVSDDLTVVGLHGSFVNEIRPRCSEIFHEVFEDWTFDLSHFLFVFVSLFMVEEVSLAFAIYRGWLPLWPADLISDKCAPEFLLNWLYDITFRTLIF